MFDKPSFKERVAALEKAASELRFLSEQPRGGNKQLAEIADIVEAEAVAMAAAQWRFQAQREATPRRKFAK